MAVAVDLLCVIRVFANRGVECTSLQSKNSMFVAQYAGMASFSLSGTDMMYACSSLLFLSQGFGISVAGIIVYRGAYFGFYDTAIGMLKPTNIVFKFLIAQAVVAASGIASYPFGNTTRPFIFVLSDYDLSLALSCAAAYALLSCSCL